MTNKKTWDMEYEIEINLLKTNHKAQNLITPYKKKWKKSQCSKPNKYIEKDWS